MSDCDGNICCEFMNPSKCKCECHKRNAERDEAIATNAKLERRLADQIEASDALKAERDKIWKLYQTLMETNEKQARDLAQAHQAMKTWDAGAVRDKAELAELQFDFNLRVIEIDKLKECLEKSLAINEMQANEISKLKAELEEYKKDGFNKQSELNRREESQMILRDDRNFWKSRAAKYREALEEVKCLELHLDNSEPPQICPVCLIDNALKETE